MFRDLEGYTMTKEEEINMNDTTSSTTPTWPNLDNWYPLPKDQPVPAGVRYAEWSPNLVTIYTPKHDCWLLHPENVRTETPVSQPLPTKLGSIIEVEEGLEGGGDSYLYVLCYDGGDPVWICVPAPGALYYPKDIRARKWKLIREGIEDSASLRDPYYREDD